MTKPSAPDSTFPAWLTAAATAAGYSGRGWQRQLSADMSVGENTISTYMLGKSRPSVGKCIRLSNCLGVEPLEVMVQAGLLSDDEAEAAKGRYALAPDELKADPALRRIAMELQRTDLPPRKRLAAEQILSGVLSLLGET